MRFKRTIKPDGTVIRNYKCNICNYEFVISRNQGKEVIIMGDEEIEIYPFFSLRSSNNDHRTLCSCPKCHCVQILKQEDEEISNG